MAKISTIEEGEEFLLKNGFNIDNEYWIKPIWKNFGPKELSKLSEYDFDTQFFNCEKICVHNIEKRDNDVILVISQDLDEFHHEMPIDFLKSVELISGPWKYTSDDGTTFAFEEDKIILSNPYSTILENDDIVQLYYHFSEWIDTFGEGFDEKDEENIFDDDDFENEDVFDGNNEEIINEQKTSVEAIVETIKSHAV